MSPPACYRYIDSLPLHAAPSVFGMSVNANMTCDQNETATLCDILLSLQPRSSSSSGRTRDEVIADTAKVWGRRPPSDQSLRVDSPTLAAVWCVSVGCVYQSISDQLPPAFDTEEVSMLHPIKYEESMNTVLVQECLRYNRLLVRAQHGFCRDNLRCVD